MSYNQVVLDLDITGKDINNKIVDEPHALSNRPARSIAPKLGPFYAEGLIIRDGTKVLQRGLDFQLVELHQEATLKYGKEINSVILIINKDISSNVTITYQALGGHYTYSDEAIGNMYQAVINDNRSVDWATGVFNKPTDFVPSIHRHLLDDVYGFESVVDYLERIKRAITLGQTTIVLEIVNSLLSKFNCRELPKVLPSNKLIQYDALLFFLSRRKIIHNIWVDKKDCNWTKGNSVVVQIDTSGYPSGVTLFWELYKPDGNVALFTSKKGTFLTNGGIQEISLYIPSDPNVIDYPIYLGIKENPSDIDYKAVTYVLDIKEHKTTDSAYGYMLYSDQDNNDYTMFIGADICDNDELRLWHQLSNY